MVSCASQEPLGDGGDGRCRFRRVEQLEVDPGVDEERRHRFVRVAADGENGAAFPGGLEDAHPGRDSIDEIAGGGGHREADLVAVR